MISRKCIVYILVSVLVSLTSLSCDDTTQFDPESTPDQIEDQSLIRDQSLPFLNDQIESLAGQYIVVLEVQENQDDSEEEIAERVEGIINSLLEKYLIEGTAVRHRYLYSVKGFSASLTQLQVDKLRGDSRVKYIEKDQKITLSPPNPASLLDLIFESHQPQETPYGITRVGGPFDGSGLTAWVIDTGVDLNHADLNVDTERSTSFVLTEPTADDQHGHGTHVSGTIAALDNDIDVIGVAAGAEIVGVKVLNMLGIGSNSDVIAGIDYVAQHATPGDVANMSLGGSASAALDEAVRNAADQGIYFALAAGNSSDDANNYSPARVEYENVWTISAINPNDAFASFSNWSGPTDPPIEFTAPGVDVESLWKNNSTNTISGTSMASPHAAGILLISNGNPTSDGTATGDPDGDPDPIIFN